MVIDDDLLDYDDPIIPGVPASSGSSAIPLTRLNWIAENLRIINKDSEIVPLEPNIGQLMLNNAINLQRNRGLPVRIILLKPRQVGWSTWIEGDMFAEVYANKNIKGASISVDEDATNTLFEMTKLFYDELPTPKRETVYSNRKEISFAKPHRSSIIAQTAGKKVLARSKNLKYVHCLDETSKIVMANGTSKQIKDIVTGDLVLDSVGNVTQVRHCTHTGQKHTKQIRVWLNNETINCTPDHNIMSLGGWKETKDLTPYDYIKTPKPVFTNTLTSLHFSLPNKERKQKGGTKHLESADIPLNYDFGFYLGYYLAEGHIKPRYKSAFNRYSHVTFTYQKEEKYISQASIFASKYATSAQTKKEGNRCRTHYYGTFLSHLTEFCCGRVADKHLPDFLFDTNEVFGRGVLDGYVAGDGSKTQHGKISITTVHERSARQLKRLIISLGLGVPGIRYKEIVKRYGKRTKPTYTLDLCGDVYRNYTTGSRCYTHKTNKFKEFNGDFYVRVRTISDIGMRGVYDLGVESDRHDFDTVIGIVKNCSEVALWENAAGQLAGLYQTVPYKPGTTIVLESTAFGVGGSFYDTFWAAVDRLKKNPDDLNGFIPVFFAWWQFPEYAVEIPPYITMQYTTVEEALVKKYNLTREQIYWRRLKIAELNGDEGLFAQEFPANAREAFQVSGRPVFSQSMLDKFALRTKPGRTVLLRNNVLPGRDDIVELIDIGTKDSPYQGGDCWRIWFLPKKGHQYSMGIDTMEGVVSDKKNERSDVDYHGVVIFDRTDSVVAAQYHGRCDQHELGVQCVLAGRLYGNAWVAIEIPNGKTVLDVFRHSDYPNLYQRQVHDYQVTEEDSDDYGWRTTTITRPWLVDGIIGILRDGDLMLYSDDIVGEMRTFIRDKTGKPIHLPGEHDDLLFGLMIAIQVHLRCPLTNINHTSAYTDTSAAKEGGILGGGIRNIAYPGAIDDDNLAGTEAGSEDYTD